MWADHALPRLRSRGLGADAVGPDLPADGHRRIAGRGDPRRGTAAPAEPGGRDVRPGRGGRRADQRGGRRRRDAATAPARRRPSSRRPPPSSRSVSRTTSGPTGDQTWSGAIGARLAERGWRLALVELGTRGQVTRCSATSTGSRVAETRPDDARPATDDATLDRSRAAGPRPGRRRGRAGGPRARAGRRHRGVGRGRDPGLGAPRDAPRVPRRQSRPDPGRADRRVRAVRGAARRRPVSRRSATRGRAQALEVRDDDRRHAPAGPTRRP